MRVGSSYRKRTFVVTFTITSVSELCSVFIRFSTLCNAYDLKKDFKTPCCTKSSVTDILSTVSSFRLLVFFSSPFCWKSITYHIPVFRWTGARTFFRSLVCQELLNLWRQIWQFHMLLFKNDRRGRLLFLS